MSGEHSMSTTPPGWIWTCLEDLLLEMRNGISTKPEGDTGVQILRISAVRPNMLTMTDVRFLAGEPEKYQLYKLNAGDLLFTRYNGTPSLVGVCAVVSEHAGSLVYPDKLIRIRLKSPLLKPEFIAYAVNTGPSRAFLSARVRTTAGQAGISGADIKATPIPLAPLGEQIRIVAEIEKQFTRLDAADASLRRAQAKLKRQRAAVLKAACEGTLLPRGGQWTELAVGEVGTVQLGRQRSPKNISDKYPTPYIRAANITERGLDVSSILDMDFTPAERSRYELADGDIVLSEASGSPDQVGKPAIWRGQIPGCCFQNTVIRLRPKLASSEFLLIVFQNYYYNRIFATIAAGVGINHLSAHKFSSIKVPLPPPDDQRRIVAEVDRRLSAIEALESQVEKDLLRSKKLRQSILKRAFEGKLVPQDPTDEPASALLERMRQPVPSSKKSRV